VGGATVFLDVLVSAVLICEAAQEGFATHGTCNVSDPVFALLGRTLNRKVLESADLHCATFKDYKQV
jgi:hypothetical protein